MAYRSPSRSLAVGSLQEMHREQQDYRASQRSTRLRPKPRGIAPMGSSADYHLRREADHLWIGELGQEYDRNNPVGQRLLNCMEDNVLQDVGFDYIPDTGSTSLNGELKEWWKELANDPQRIDLQGRFTFDELTRLVFRSTLAAGDIFPVFNQEGPIELREFHRCRQPSKTGKAHKNNVHGVEMDEQRRRLGYWFTKEPIDPLASASIKHSDLERVAAFDESDEWRLPNVLHVYDPKRTTQTRGVSMFAPVFDYLGMHDDCQFQQLVRQQISNMLLIVRTRDRSFNEEYLSSRQKAGVDHPDPTISDRILESLYPGAELPGLPGETLTPWAPNLPGDSWFDHMRLVLRLIGIAWGTPYVLLMLDTADTNFHGYRGAVNEAQTLFRRMQMNLCKQWATPVVTHYLHRLADEDPAFRSWRDKVKNSRSKINLFKHSWTRPGWDSVDPLKDASANLLELANSLTSRTRIARNADTDWPTLSREIVNDNLAHLLNGVEAAKQYGKALGVENPQPEQLERWISLIAPTPTADRTQISLQLGDASQPATGGTDG